MYVLRCTCITLVIGIPFFIAGVNGAQKKSEESHARPHETAHALQKRQLNAQLSPFVQQPFPASFISEQPIRNDPISQFPGQVTDEEERFFLSGNQQETTLNPLAFINPPRTTTPSPAEQQAVNEQRRFQEEIANKGLREQEQRSFGLPQPPTTRPTTTTSTTTQNPFDPFSFQVDPFASTDPQADFEQSTENFFFNDDRRPQSPSVQSLLPQPELHQPQFPQSVQPQLVLSQSATPRSHSYAYSRIYRSVDRKTRSIDRQQFSVNLLPTPAPQQFYYNEKRSQTTPRTEYGTIGNWLISRFTQQLQQNIASLSQTTAAPYSRAVKSPNPQNYRRPNYTERPYSTPNYQSTPQPWQHPEPSFHSTSPPWHIAPSTEIPTSPRPFQHAEVPSWSPLRFQIPQFQEPTEPSPKNNALSYLPNAVIQTTSIPPAVVSFKPLPAAYMVQPHIPLVPQSAPTHLPYTPATSDKRVKNVQILTSSPIPDDLSAQSPNEATFQAYRQVFASEHQTGPVVTQSTPAANEENTSITSIFKSKLNEFKSFHPSQVAALEDAQSKFQLPNQFLDQLQTENPLTNSNSADSVDSTNGSGKTAIFIRVPEEPTSTVGYVFDKAISAKTLQKKENLTAHKKNYRSAQVIKSSLVYRTPPGKRATVSREEQLENSQVNTSDTRIPIKWLLAGAPTTPRPLVRAFLHLIQK